MRLLRFFLQLLILALLLPILFLVVRQQPLEFNALVAAAGLFVLLLLLTLLLREHTAQRREPHRAIGAKVQGALIGCAGGGLLWLAWLVASGQYRPGGRRGLLLMQSIELLGPWLPATVFLALGMQLLWRGYRAWRGR